jgi:hypothetical protein
MQLKFMERHVLQFRTNDVADVRLSLLGMTLTQIQIESWSLKIYIEKYMSFERYATSFEEVFSCSAGEEWRRSAGPIV